MATSYDIGDVAVLENTFTDQETGAVEDPSIVRVRVRDPRNGLVTYTYGLNPEVVRESQGVYSVRVFLNKPLHWFIRFEGPQDTIEGVAEEHSVYVRPSKFYTAAGDALPDT